MEQKTIHRIEKCIENVEDILKGGPGSGVKGHKTAEKVKFDIIARKRKIADAKAQKDIDEGQSMINEGEALGKKAFEAIMEAGRSGDMKALAKADKEQKTAKKIESQGWEKRIAGQNRKQEIGEKHHAAAMKIMGF